MQKIIKLLCVALVLCAFTVSAKSCKGLVLEAGGDLGAYEAGVIQGLVDAHAQLNQLDELSWDVFSGVSVGAINAAYMNQFSKSETVEMAANLVQLWRKITKDDVYKNYLGGIVQGLVFESSLYKTDPLKAFLTKQLNRKQERLLSVGATNANTGVFTRFNETLSNADLVQALMASSAVPALFPYQAFQGETYFDGGVVRATDIYGAIERCLQIVDEPSEITLDIVLISSKHINSGVELPLHPIKVGTLANNIKSFSKSRRSLIEAHDYYPNINWRYIINPTKKLPHADYPFSFKPSETETMISAGIADAQAAVAEHIEFSAREKSNSGESVDNMSISARKVFIEAYESLFEQYDVKVSSVASE